MLKDRVRKDAARKINRKSIKISRTYPLLLLTIGLITGFLLFNFVPFAVHGASGVRSDSGLTAAAIQATVDQFRADLGGGTMAAENGSFGGQRREINFDNMPDVFSAPNQLPANLFNSDLPPGVFSTRETGFQISSQRLLTSLGCEITDVTFFVPGTTRPATVSGFGAIFKYLDGKIPVTIQLFDADNGDLGTFQVPASEGDQGYSFLGISFSAGERIARAQIRSESDKLASLSNPMGLSYLMFSEPQPNTVTAPFVVTNTNDDGAGSLRQAILDANATPGFDTINFNIPGSGVKKISLASPLPFITDPVMIDGYSQPGSSQNTLQNGDDAVLLIELDGTDATTDTNGLEILAGNSTVRGLIINRFGGNGISLNTNGANMITGNFIGTDSLGILDLGNGHHGILLFNSANNVIGGNTPAARNLISGNDEDGINVGQGGVSSANEIQGNLIGTDSGGVAALANSSNGITIANGSGNVIGTGFAEASNTIAFNGGDGILVLAGNTNQFIFNSIFSNILLGIDLVGDGVTANDYNDSDTGPNDLQNFPMLQQYYGNSGVSSNSTSTTVTGSLTSIPNRSFLIDFYTSPTCDSSGSGEGETFFREIVVTTNSSGSANFSATFPAPVPVGQFMTATATAFGGSTSEFSPCAQIASSGSTLQFSSSSFNVNEGSGFVNISVSRSGNTSNTVSVDYAISDGTATAGQDYTPTFGTLTFNQFESFKSFNIPILDDSVIEPNETANLTLNNPTGGASLASPSTAVLTIVDSESLVQFSSSTYSVIEGPGSGFATILVNRTGNSGNSISVNFATNDGSATAGQDYLATSGTITFGSFEFSKSISVPIIDDSLTEPGETVNLTLSSISGGVLSSPSTAVLTIIDNELPGLSINDVSVNEGDSGVSNATFTVNLSSASGSPVRVNYATADGTARAGDDYIAISGLLTFNPGEITKTVTVAVVGDNALEPDELLALNLSNPFSAIISDGQGIGTILNDDVAPLPSPSPTGTPLVSNVQFSAASFNVGEGANGATITVTRTGDTSTAVTIDYTTSDSSAQQRSDYTLAAGTLRFAAGETGKTFEVLIDDDMYKEGNEVLNLSLSNPTGGEVLGSLSSSVVTIQDNDSGPPSANPIDNAQFFVRQHYSDFLNRAPDQGGLDYWSDRISQCGTDVTCLNSRRVGVSAAYFIELEFQDTGSFVYRFYKATYGKRPTYEQLMADRRRVVDGENIEIAKQAFADQWVQRSEFLAKYPVSLTGTEFIDALIQTVQQGSGVDLSNRRQILIDDFAANNSRSRILRMVADDATLKQAEYNRAFVLMQYFGYLRRDPDEGGYLFWLNIINDKVPGNFRSMVCAFISSAEYQDRFSSIRTRNDSVCSAIGP
jgi:Calx-beta domain-containing protein